MSLVVRKPVFGVSAQVRHKPGYYNNRRWLEARNLGFRKKRDCTFYIAKTKALISCAVTAQLICGFVFAYAKNRFSHDEAQMTSRNTSQRHRLRQGVICLKVCCSKTGLSLSLPDLLLISWTRSDPTKG